MNRRPFRPRKIIFPLIGDIAVAKQQEQPEEKDQSPPAPKAADKPQTSGYDPIATMEKEVKDRAEAEEKARTEAEEVQKQADKAAEGKEPVAYVVSHAVVGSRSRGDVVQSADLIPVPKDASEEDAKKLRKDGIRRLVDLGAITAVYEEE
jgi:hypothetical protein